MSQRAMDVYEAALDLNEDEFEELMQLLSESNRSVATLHPAWADEIKRRVAEVDAGTAATISFEESRLRSRKLLSSLYPNHGNS